jgi:hypothetical protein
LKATGVGQETSVDVGQVFDLDVAQVSLAFFDLVSGLYVCQEYYLGHVVPIWMSHDHGWIVVAMVALFHVDHHGHVCLVISVVFDDRSQALTKS